MKYIKLLLSNRELKDKFVDILKPFHAKIINDHIVIPKNLFTDFRKKIISQHLNVSISKDPDYVIIKERNMIVQPPEFATLEYVNRRFQKIEDRLDKIEYRLDQMDERFNKIEKRLDEIDEKFKIVFKCLDVISKRLDVITDRLDIITNSLNVAFSHLNIVFNHLGIKQPVSTK